MRGQVDFYSCMASSAYKQVEATIFRLVLVCYIVLHQIIVSWETGHSNKYGE